MHEIEREKQEKEKDTLKRAEEEREKEKLKAQEDVVMDTTEAGQDMKDGVIIGS